MNDAMKPLSLHTVERDIFAVFLAFVSKSIQVCKFFFAIEKVGHSQATSKHRCDVTGFNEVQGH